MPTAFVAKTVGGIPVLSEREFVEAKAARDQAELSRKAAEQSMIIEQIAVEKKEKGNKIRKKKSSALQKRVAAAAERDAEVASERAAVVELKLKQSHETAYQLDGQRRSSDPQPVVVLNESQTLNTTPFKRREIPMVDVAPGSPKRGRASVAEKEAEKREIETGLELGRLRLEENNGVVYCVQTNTNLRRYDLDPMRHGIAPPEVKEHFEDGFKTIKRGGTTRNLVEDHATKQKSQMRRQNSMQLEDKAAAFLASLK